MLKRDESAWWQSLQMKFNNGRSLFFRSGLYPALFVHIVLWLKSYILYDSGKILIINIIIYLTSKNVMIVFFLSDKKISIFRKIFGHRTENDVFLISYYI